VREPTDFLSFDFYNPNTNITNFDYWIWTLDAWTGTNKHTRDPKQTGRLNS
jgi:hypothetical protein